MAISDKLSELIQDKEDIRKAINDKGGNSPANHNFSNFAEDIRNIPQETTEITQNFTGDPLVNTERYIEFNGQSYIDLGRPLYSDNDYFFCQFKWNGLYSSRQEDDNNTSVFGERYSNSKDACSLLISSSKFIWRANTHEIKLNGSSSATDVSIKPSNIYSGIFQKRGAFINNLYGTYTSNTNYGSPIPVYSLYIGATNQRNEPIFYFQGRIYRFTWWKDQVNSSENVLPAMDLIPAYNNGQYCFYDTVGKQYYYATAGTLSGNV